MNSRTTKTTPGRCSAKRTIKNLYGKRSSLKIKDPKSLLSSVRSVLAYANITDEKIVSTVLVSTDRFYSDFCQGSVGLGTRQLEDHFEACKRRAKLLTELDQKIQSSNFNEWEEFGIIRRSADSSHYSPFKGKWENRLTLSYFDSDEVNNLFELKIDPKCYKPLFLGLYLVIDYLSYADEFEKEENNNIIHIISSLFVSVGMLYTTMRSNLDHAKSCVDKTVININVPADLSETENYFTIDYNRFDFGVGQVFPPGHILNETKYSIRCKDVDPFVLRKHGYADEYPFIRLYDLFQSIKTDIHDAIDLFKRSKSILPVFREQWLKENYPKDLRYVMDIARSASRVDFTRKYDRDRDDHISMKSSGTSFKNRTLPALYASLVETDNYLEESKQFDSIIGYVSDYRKDTCSYVEQGSNVIKSVEPPSKIDIRPIFIVDNPQQDRLSWFHNILMDLMNGMDCDCTSRQFASVRFLIKRTNKEYRMRFHNAVYTLDIADATNTCSLQFQKECLSIFFSEPLVDWWCKTMNHENKIYYPQDSKPHGKTRRLRGQSQGAKSSFPAFALMHHILYLMAIKLKAWVDTNANAVYRIIGDDSGSSTVDSDKDLSFRNAYIQVCRWMGWEVNPQKGFSAPANTEVAFAEMAKVRILNGRINTPVPPRLLIKGGKTPIDAIALSKWFSSNYLDDNLDINVVIDNSCLSLRNDLYKEKLRKLVAIAPSDAFHGLVSSEEFTDEEEAFVIMTLTKTKLEATLINEILPEHAQTDEDRFRKLYTKYGLYNSLENFHLSGEFWNDAFVQSSTSSKYTRLYNRHENLIHALKSSLGIRSYVAECVVALRLSNSEINIIYNLIEVIKSFDEDRIIPMPINTLRDLSNQVFKILDRYQDRSDVRRSLQSAFFADDIIDKMIENEDIINSISFY